MIIVLPFCCKDAELTKRNLQWCLELDSGCGREGVLSYDRTVDAVMLSEIEKLAGQYFTKVHHCKYENPPVPGWPAACNWAWQSTARWMWSANLKQPWFWMEADAIPTQSGWFAKLDEAFRKGGKSFGGHVVKDMGHMNGVGIYPWDVMARNEMAMLARAAAWDVVLKITTQDDITPLNSLIQHAWNVRDDGMIWNGDGRPLSFREQSDVDRWMDFNAVIIHRCKDGSLIPLLSERIRKRAEAEAFVQSTEYNVPQHTKATAETNDLVPSGKRNVVREGEDGRVDGASVPEDSIHSDDVSINKVPLGEASQARDGVRSLAVRSTHFREIPATEIFIVTYWKDKPWLEYCIKALKKHVTGFQGVTIAIPKKDVPVFGALAVNNPDLRWHHYDEVPGKGMIQHMAIMGMADQIVPKTTEFVCHVDADCIFHTPTTPLDYFEGNKPVYLVRSWESLTTEDPKSPGTKVISDCAQWFAPTTRQLGFKPKVYTMCRHPTVFPIGFYRQYRDWIEVEHNKGFVDYMLSGRNEFPQTVMDWTAMGAFAYEFMQHQFHWVDIGKEGAVVPKDRQKTFWSHGGVDFKAKEEMERFIA